MIDVAGLSSVTPGLVLVMVVVAVLLNVIPNVFSRPRDGKRKEAVRMNSDSADSSNAVASMLSLFCARQSLLRNRRSTLSRMFHRLRRWHREGES
jgi:hypothetical protein